VRRLKRSGHNYCESSLHKGGAETKNMGTLLAVALLMRTDDGHQLLDYRINDQQIVYICESIFCLITAIQWFHSSPKKEVVHNAKGALRRTNDDTKPFFPRSTSMSGPSQKSKVTSSGITCTGMVMHLISKETGVRELTLTS
jgi:hypothetical protein